MSNGESVSGKKITEELNQINKNLEQLISEISEIKEKLLNYPTNQKPQTSETQNQKNILNQNPISNITETNNENQGFADIPEKPQKKDSQNATSEVQQKIRNVEAKKIKQNLSEIGQEALQAPQWLGEDYPES